MKKATEIFLKMGKTIIFALLAVQYVYAVWWVIHNIGVVPDFAIDSESILYEQAMTMVGKGFFVIYLLQAGALYYGIQRLFSKNQWVARFTITNPLIMQFVFALTPDVFCISILLVFLSSLLHNERIKSKHAIYLVVLGILSARYFIAGIFVLIVIAVSQYIRDKKNIEVKEITKKENISRILVFVQVCLVVVLVLISYQTQKNVEDYTSIQQGSKQRFTVDEKIPSNHSILSVSKGFVTDTFSYILTPYTSLYVIDEKKLTQNSWNYINFTREEPKISKAFLELSERNMTLALAVAVIGSLLTFAFINQNKKIEIRYLLFIFTSIGLCALFVATTKRGMDYRNGLLVIPIWYHIILSVFNDIHILPEKGETKLLCS